VTPFSSITVRLAPSRLSVSITGLFLTPNAVWLKSSSALMSLFPIFTTISPRATPAFLAIGSTAETSTPRPDEVPEVAGKFRRQLLDRHSQCVHGEW